MTVENFKKAIWPSGIELQYSLLIAIALVLVSVLPTIIVQINFLYARDMLQSEVGAIVSKLLMNIDGLKFSATVITFIFWTIVGLFTYGLVSVLYTALHTIEEDVEISSDEYVHPKPYSRIIFWRQVLRESLLYVDTAVLILLIASIDIFALLPAATTHVRQMIVDFKPDVLVTVFASTILLVGGVWLLIQAVKVWHHRNLLLE